MSGDLTTIIEAIKNRLAALGFKPANAIFDFDAVPASVMDRAYRIETRLTGNEYILGNRAMTTEAIEIYIAYKLGRVPAGVWSDALDDRETIEKDIINDATIAALSQGPILTLNEEAVEQKYLEEYLVSKIVFRCDYIRDLTPTT